MKLGRLMSVALIAALAATGCKKSDKGTPAATPAAATDAAAAIDAAAPAPAIDAAPALPSLGPPPAGVDAKLAAACDGGDAKACFDAAKAFEPKGAYRVDMTKEEADLHEEWTRRFGVRACDLGNGDGCLVAARFKSLDSALIARGCELGSLAACGDKGASLAEHEKTIAEGLPLLEKACRANAIGLMGDIPGSYCARLASIYAGDDDHPANKDAAKAKEFLELQCKQGFKIDCPCKTDEDCQGGSIDEDQGDIFCADNVCAIESPD